MRSKSKKGEEERNKKGGRDCREGGEGEARTEDEEKR